MKPLFAEKPGGTAHVVPSSRRLERVFFTSMAAAMAITVFAGFARTYYLKPLFGTPQLTPLLHLHGIVFTSWILLFITQTTLVAGNRTRVHRRLGIVGAVIATLMVIIGTGTAIYRAASGPTQLTGPDPLVFLVVPLGDMLLFSTLVVAGFYFRRRPDVHKRMMLFATVAILPAAVARLPGVVQYGPLAFFGLADLFIVACLAYDLVVRRRVHRATVLGGLLIIVSQPLRLMIGGTGAWLTFATWLTQFVEC